MVGRTRGRSVTGAAGVALGMVVLAGGVLAAAVSPPLPKFSAVKQTVLGCFDRVEGYQSGDVISRSQVEAVLRALARKGWQVADQKAILNAVLSDSDPLVGELRTPSGKKFARRVAKIPAGYDRLDRLRRLPRGRQNVRNLIRGPDGHLMIEYMTTTPGGANLGKLLSEDPGGEGFNEPTGRIYTVRMLLDRLEREYAKATGAGAKREPEPRQASGAARVPAP